MSQLERLLKRVNEKRVNELEQEIERLQAKVERLTARGLQDLNWDNDELRAEVKRLRKMMEHVDELLEVIDRHVPKDGLRSWRYDIHVARSRISDGKQK